MKLGIDRLAAAGFCELRGLKIGLCTNIPATDSRNNPTLELFRSQRYFDLSLIFAPEHGLAGALQDQVAARDGRCGRTPVISLYGRRTVPDLHRLAKIDAAVIDLIDIGTRYYTFAWTALLLIAQMARLSKPTYVLDRPNPLGGEIVAGPVLEERYASFVGLYPVPVRHGMTIGELCLYVNECHNLGGRVSVVRMQGWRRSFDFPRCRLTWPFPSPNMPTFQTAVVYPGMCLLEGTNVSEGRGTTRPFEIFGAPWIEPPAYIKRLRAQLAAAGIRGCTLRPAYFKPTFGKYRGALCGGVQVDVTDRARFEPVLFGLAAIRTLLRTYRRRFRWRPPPYEMEKKKLPFDILIGNSWVRRALIRGETLRRIESRWQGGLERFIRQRRRFLLYR